MELNSRQTAYLLALYRLDLKAGINNKRASLRGEGKPAAQWRWIEYGPNGLPEILNYDPPL